LLELVALEVLIARRSERMCPFEKTLYFTRQKLIQSEAIYEKSHMDLRD
jgi:hypothetical protein